MGIEMEAGRPGWYDAMNGLPGLFGSSMPETFELKRLLSFLLRVIKEHPQYQTEFPSEAYELLEEVLQQLANYHNSNAVNRDFVYWDAVSSAREKYRYQIQLGIDVEQKSIAQNNLLEILKQLIQKVDMGIQRALESNNAIPPTYFRYQVDDYDVIQNSVGEPETDAEGRPYIRIKKFTPIPLPIFLARATRRHSFASGVSPWTSPPILTQKPAQRGDTKYNTPTSSTTKTHLP